MVPSSVQTFWGTILTEQVVIHAAVPWVHWPSEDHPPRDLLLGTAQAHCPVPLAQVQCSHTVCISLQNSVSSPWSEPLPRLTPPCQPRLDHPNEICVPIVQWHVPQHPSDRSGHMQLEKDHSRSIVSRVSVLTFSVSLLRLPTSHFTAGGFSKKTLW